MNMTPAQASVVVEEEKKPQVVVKTEVVENNGDLKENGSAEDVEVDVLGDGGDAQPAAREESEATEYSSSFGETLSGTDEASNLSSSDAEVESGLRVQAETRALPNGLLRVCRKKKLTDHWRNFIRPLMWRCQWVELRVHELDLQILKYDNELAKYTHEKQLRSTMIDLDSSASRTVPLTYQSHRRQAMKRRKRKRKEETVDVLSYMSHHNIFSYYENKRSEIDRHSVDEDCSNPVDERKLSADVFEALNDWLTLGSSDASLERVLLKIEAVQSRLTKLRSRLDAITKTNTREIPPIHGFLGPGDQSYSIAPSPGSSPRSNGDAMLHGAEYETDDLALPGSTVSSYGDAAQPDIVESTLDLLSAAPLDQHHFGDLCKDNADDVLITNQAADEELQNFGKANHVTEQNHELVKEDAECSSFDESTAPKDSATGASPEKEKPNVPQPPVLKPCYSGKKRGRKPKRKRRGGYSANSRSERLQKQRLS